MNSVVFLLDVYEIEGKNNVTVYVDKLKKRLDAINIKYKFKDVTSNFNQSESFNKIKTMDKSFFDKFFDSAGVDKRERSAGISSIELEIYDDSIFNIKSLGVYQLNNWIRRKENKEEHIPLL
jgi:hypothetical protein